MKRILILSIFIVTASALAASGAVPYVSYTRTVGSMGGRDKIDFFFTTDGFPSDVALAIIEGTWTSDGTMILNKATSSPTWKVATTAGGADSSTINFDDLIANAKIWGRTGSSDGAYFNAETFGGTWYTTNAYAQLSPGGLNPDGDPLSSLIATIYVTPSKDVSYSGVFGWVGRGPLRGTVTSASFRTPEPSSLVLLGIGAISLLAYGWRRW